MDKPERSWKNWQEVRDELVAEAHKLKPLTQGQACYIEAIQSATITICSGPAGSGKSICACGVAIQLLREKKIERIILTRPLVQCRARFSDGLGILPGELDEKIAPYMRPLLDALDTFCSSSKELEKFFREGKIEMWPLEVMRGSSVKGSMVLLDESQNASMAQLRMFLTRLDKGTRMVLNGDASQSDLPQEGENPLRVIMDKLRGHKDIAIVELTHKDVVRHPLVAFIDERLASPTAEESGRG